jgi:hypothetical protein
MKKCLIDLGGILALVILLNALIPASDVIFICLRSANEARYKAGCDALREALIKQRDREIEMDKFIMHGAVYDNPR